eukprot:Rmarinus@m.18665
MADLFSGLLGDVIQCEKEYRANRNAEQQRTINRGKRNRAKDQRNEEAQLCGKKRRLSKKEVAAPAFIDDPSGTLHAPRPPSPCGSSLGEMMVPASTTIQSHHATGWRQLYTEIHARALQSDDNIRNLVSQSLYSSFFVEAGKLDGAPLSSEVVYDPCGFVSDLEKSRRFCYKTLIVSVRGQVPKSIKHLATMTRDRWTYTRALQVKLHDSLLRTLVESKKDEYSVVQQDALRALLAGFSGRTALRTMLCGMAKEDDLCRRLRQMAGQGGTLFGDVTVQDRSDLSVRIQNHLFGNAYRFSRIVKVVFAATMGPISKKVGRSEAAQNYFMSALRFLCSGDSVLPSPRELFEVASGLVRLSKANARARARSAVVARLNNSTTAAGPVHHDDVEREIEGDGESESDASEECRGRADRSPYTGDTAEVCRRCRKHARDPLRQERMFVKSGKPFRCARCHHLYHWACRSRGFSAAADSNKEPTNWESIQYCAECNAEWRDAFSASSVLGDEAWKAWTEGLERFKASMERLQAQLCKWRLMIETIVPGDPESEWLAFSSRDLAPLNVSEDDGGDDNEHAGLLASDQLRGRRLLFLAGAVALCGGWQREHSNGVRLNLSPSDTSGAQHNPRPDCGDCRARTRHQRQLTVLRGSTGNQASSDVYPDNFLPPPGDTWWTTVAGTTFRHLLRGRWPRTVRWRPLPLPQNLEPGFFRVTPTILKSSMFTKSVGEKDGDKVVRDVLDWVATQTVASEAVASKRPKGVLLGKSFLFDGFSLRVPYLCYKGYRPASTLDDSARASAAEKVDDAASVRKALQGLIRDEGIFLESVGDSLVGVAVDDGTRDTAFGVFTANVSSVAKAPRGYRRVAADGCDGGAAGPPRLLVNADLHSSIKLQPACVRIGKREAMEVSQQLTLRSCQSQLKARKKLTGVGDKERLEVDDDDDGLTLLKLQSKFRGLEASCGQLSQLEGASATVSPLLKHFRRFHRSLAEELYRGHVGDTSTAPAVEPLSVLIPAPGRKGRRRERRAWQPARGLCREPSSTMTLGDLKTRHTNASKHGFRALLRKKLQNCAVVRDLQEQLGGMPLDDVLRRTVFILDKQTSFAGNRLPLMKRAVLRLGARWVYQSEFRTSVGDTTETVDDLPPVLDRADSTAQQPAGKASRLGYRWKSRRCRTCSKDHATASYKILCSNRPGRPTIKQRDDKAVRDQETYFRLRLAQRPKPLGLLGWKGAQVRKAAVLAQRQRQESPAVSSASDARLPSPRFPAPRPQSLPPVRRDDSAPLHNLQPQPTRYTRRTSTLSFSSPSSPSPRCSPHVQPQRQQSLQVFDAAQSSSAPHGSSCQNKPQATPLLLSPLACDTTSSGHGSLASCSTLRPFVSPATAPSAPLINSTARSRAPHQAVSTGALPADSVIQAALEAARAVHSNSGLTRDHFYLWVARCILYVGHGPDWEHLPVYATDPFAGQSRPEKTRAGHHRPPTRRRQKYNPRRLAWSPAAAE